MKAVLKAVVAFAILMIAAPITPAAAAVAPAGVNGTSYGNLGTLTNASEYDSEVGFSSSGDITPLTYAFTVSSTSTIWGNILNEGGFFDGSTQTGTSPLTVKLEDSLGGVLAFLTADSSLTAGTVTLSADTVYQLVVSGTITGSTGGAYALSFGVSAVPLPGALLLFGSGLLGLAAFGRRRARKS